MGNFEDLEIYRNVLGSLQNGVCLMDRTRKIFFWNDGAERVTGYLRHEVLGHSCSDTILQGCDESGCSLCSGVCPVRKALLDGRRRESSIYFHHKEGHRIPVHVWSVPIRDENESVVGVAESFEGRSFVDQRRSHDSLAAYGCLDETIGIPNRGFTEFHLRENLAKFAEYKVPFAVVLIRVNDIDSLKHTHGREALDTILGLVARTLRNSFRPVDFLGRWEEDQFLTIALNCASTGLTKVIERVRRVLHHEGVQWWGDKLLVTTTLGSTAVEPEDTIESLLQRAERSLQQDLAKAAVAGSGGQSNRSSGN
ncbi:MAG: diguanylate cyclase [Terriglobales bacterium]